MKSAKGEILVAAGEQRGGPGTSPYTPVDAEAGRAMNVRVVVDSLVVLLVLAAPVVAGFNCFGVQRIRNTQQLAGA